MHLQPDPVPEAVPEQGPEAGPLNVVPSQSIGIPTGHAGFDTPRRALVGGTHDVVDATVLRARSPHHDRARHVGAVAPDDGPEVHEQEVSRLDLPWRRVRVRQCRARTAGDDRRKGKSLAASLSKLLLEYASHGQLRHPDPKLGEGAVERGRGHVGSARDALDLRVVLSLAERLDEVHRGPPLPACAGLQEPLKIAMQDVRGLEAEHLQRAQLGELLPEARPEARRLDHDPREVPHLVGDLRLVTEVGDEHEVALAHDEKRARAREAGEIADVRQPGEQQTVEVRHREAVDERGHAARSGVGHARGPLSAATRPRSASSYPSTPSPTTPPIAAGASIECRRSGSRAYTFVTCTSTKGTDTPTRASRSARLLCEYAPAFTTAPSTRPRIACTASTSWPSPLNCAHSSSTPSSLATSPSLRSTSASVARP